MRRGGCGREGKGGDGRERGRRSVGMGRINRRGGGVE